jgi:hypothetical protein
MRRRGRKVPFAERTPQGVQLNCEYCVDATRSPLAWHLEILWEVLPSCPFDRIFTLELEVLRDSFDGHFFDV